MRDNEERNQKIYALAEAGWSHKRIAGRLCLSRYTVRWVIRRWRRAQAAAEGRRYYPPEACKAERNQKIVAMLASGMKQADIARALRCTPSAISGAVDRMRRRGVLPPVPVVKRWEFSPDLGTPQRIVTIPAPAGSQAIQSLLAHADALIAG